MTNATDAYRLLLPDQLIKPAVAGDVTSWLLPIPNVHKYANYCKQMDTLWEGRPVWEIGSRNALPGQHIAPVQPGQTFWLGEPWEWRWFGNCVVVEYSDGTRSIPQTVDPKDLAGFYPLTKYPAETMPEWACRLTGTITAEPVQLGKLTDEQCKKLGYERIGDGETWFSPQTLLGIDWQELHGTYDPDQWCWLLNWGTVKCGD